MKTKFSGIIEIDESLFGRKIKYHRGRPLGQRVWVFGLVERQSKCIKLFPVDTRDEEILTTIIRQNVEPGSTIYSDGWAAYRNLTQLSYEHYVVKHKYAFRATYKHAERGEIINVHTNRIEGAWKHAKVKIYL